MSTLQAYLSRANSLLLILLDPRFIDTSVYLLALLININSLLSFFKICSLYKICYKKSSRILLHRYDVDRRNSREYIAFESRLCLHGGEFTACIHPKMLIYKSRRHRRDAARLSLSMRVYSLFHESPDNAIGGERKEGKGWREGSSRCIRLTCYLSGETSSMLHPQSRAFWPAYRKSNRQARLDYRYRDVYRSIWYYTCVRPLFTVAFPRDVNCIPAENAPEMHRRVFSSVVDRLRWPRFEKSPVDACKKRADVDRYRRDKLASFSLAGKIAKRIAALDVL